LLAVFHERWSSSSASSRILRSRSATKRSTSSRPNVRASRGPRIGKACLRRRPRSCMRDEAMPRATRSASHRSAYSATVSPVPSSTATRPRSASKGAMAMASSRVVPGSKRTSIRLPVARLTRTPTGNVFPSSAHTMDPVAGRPPFATRLRSSLRSIELLLEVTTLNGVLVRCSKAGEDRGDAKARPLVRPGPERRRRRASFVAFALAGRAMRHMDRPSCGPRDTHPERVRSGRAPRTGDASCEAEGAWSRRPGLSPGACRRRSRVRLGRRPDRVQRSPLSRGSRCGSRCLPLLGCGWSRALVGRRATTHMSSESGSGTNAERRLCGSRLGVLAAGARVPSGGAPL